MRRRRPRTIKLSHSEQCELERLFGDGRTEQRVVRRGQVLLAMKNPKTLVSEPGQRVGLTRIGIWYVCRRYETMGLDAIYDAPRSGRHEKSRTMPFIAIGLLILGIALLVLLAFST